MSPTLNVKTVFRLALTFITLVILICPKKILVISLILGSKLIAPEASAILSHYCFGNGKALYLDASYIKTSPVVLKNIGNLKIGQERKVSLKQCEDWRLSYALNPFTIKRTQDGYTVYQYIEFDKKGIVRSKLNLGIAKITVYDSIVHTFDCKPFMVILRF